MTCFTRCVETLCKGCVETLHSEMWDATHRAPKPTPSFRPNASLPQDVGYFYLEWPNRRSPIVLPLALELARSVDCVAIHRLWQTLPYRRRMELSRREAMPTRNVS